MRKDGKITANQSCYYYITIIIIIITTSKPSSCNFHWGRSSVFMETYITDCNICCHKVQVIIDMHHHYHHHYYYYQAVLVHSCMKPSSLKLPTSSLSWYSSPKFWCLRMFEFRELHLFSRDVSHWYKFTFKSSAFWAKLNIKNWTKQVRTVQRAKDVGCYTSRWDTGLNTHKYERKLK